MTPATVNLPIGPASASIPSFNFILQPEFPLNALVLASEALRIANQNSGREHFQWRFVSETGAPMRASNGLWMPVDDSFQTIRPADYYLVFEGNLPTQHNSPKLLGQLRNAVRFGASIGAVDTGAFALADAGLVDERGVVLHWEAAPAFRESYPHLNVQKQIFSIERHRLSCAGGVATLDMMLALIGQLKSPALASEVANALVYVPRLAEALQRPEDQVFSQTRSLAQRISMLMEQHLDFPLSIADLGERLSISPKTLQRECQKAFGEAPMRHYLRIRLEAARTMLFYQEFDISMISTACGFSYPSVFSRAFKNHFDMTPRAYRALFRDRQSEEIGPGTRAFRA
jgi:AraC family carnitine catabolism transcriptional activator